MNVIARSADVIHSFWVPQLNRKIDMIPGHPNRLLLDADAPGRYRGQCAELCGPQHSHMGVAVIAQEPDDFRAWLRAMTRPRPAPATPEQRRGERVFEAQACASCHTIRGTPARGRVGPDLTHVMDRSTLAALTIPNTPARMTEWIRQPQRLKPGNQMPAFALSRAEVRLLVSYLEARK